jgi:two-component system response regulator FlrC
MVAKGAIGDLGQGTQTSYSGGNVREGVVSVREVREEGVWLESRSPTMAQVLELMREVAASDTTVLVTGETGTGKEVLARQLHQLSHRARGPFIAVNCGALPSQLIESELFGHERGAFSGALDRRIGHFEAAQGGTLLLDEVSEIPLPLQTRLLRVLQEREVQRIGASRVVPLDVRIVATTNRDLRAMVERGELRKDLFYRLNVFPLALPPLRDRKEDLPDLARAILERLARGRTGRRDASARSLRAGYVLSIDALEALVRHDFPGNVRELANLLERATILSRDGIVDASALDLYEPPRTHASPFDPTLASIPDNVIRLAPRAAEVRPELMRPEARIESRGHAAADRSGRYLAGEPESPRLKTIEREMILSALAACRGNRTHASERLGISVRTLRNKIRALRELGLEVPEPLPPTRGLAGGE